MDRENQSTGASVAICGTRGIPACYGGFETFCEQIAPRLADKGYAVRVYGRTHVIDYAEKFYKGVEIVLLPALKHKYLETLSHSFLSFLHLLFNRVDVVLVCNAANSPLIWILKLFRFRVVVNVDGIERKRAKWNALGRLWYRLGELTSVWWADDLISDALVIEDYYKDTYGRDSTVIAYGHSEAFREEVELKAKAAGRGEVAPAGLNPKIFEEGERFLAEFGLKPFEYFLYVSRLEPENNAHTAIEAHAHLDTDKPLLIVGDAPYATEYKAKLKSLAGENVKFAGFRFGTLYHYLQLFCHSYIQATEVGGTHPALVEAMGFSSAIAANDTPEHREVLGSRGCFYDFNSVESLARVLRNFDSDPRILTEARVASFERARSTYSWPAVLEAYETLLFKRS